MARPKKQTVDYFPHMVASGKTMFILESQFGNDGYALWFKILELIGASDGHVYDCGNSSDWQFLIAKTNLTEEKAKEILQLLAELGAIDKELWSVKVVWVQNFVENIADVYKKRKVKIPQKPNIDSFGQRKPSTKVVSDSGNSPNDDIEGVSDSENPQSKVKESKVKESKDTMSGKPDHESIPYQEIISYLNQKADRQYKSSTGKTKSFIKARWSEGFRLEDFKQVINNKVAEWLNNDMSKYLRPETLFGPKFEGYLNERGGNPQNGSELDDVF